MLGLLLLGRAVMLTFGLAELEGGTDPSGAIAAETIIALTLGAIATLAWLRPKAF